MNNTIMPFEFNHAKIILLQVSQSAAAIFIILHRIFLFESIAMLKKKAITLVSYAQT